ncbi:MAG: DUF2892 domain-containing protein [Caldilineaceae bacterium]|nr:DUF2892 domain-containing protein [Caldilineaceae bacterium]
MVQPYTEQNEKEEITPQEYASGKDRNDTHAAEEYVTSGSAPQTYPSDESTPQSQQSESQYGEAQHRGSQGRYQDDAQRNAPGRSQNGGNGQQGQEDRRGYYDTDRPQNWSRTTTGHAPQTYPRNQADTRNQPYAQPQTFGQEQTYRMSPYGTQAAQPYYQRDEHRQRGYYQQQRQGGRNVDQTERQIAVATGGMLLLHAVLTRSRLSLLTGALGAALIWHGQSRHSPIYDALDMNTARQPLWERTPWDGGNGRQQQGDWQRQQEWQQRTMQQRQEPRQEPRRGNTIEIERAVTVNKPAEELYNYWRKLENLPNFMEHLQTVEQTDETHSHWVASLAGGLPVAWDAEIVEDKENERIVWRTLPDAQVQQSGVVTFQEATGERGTVVHVDIKYSPPGGVVGEAFARMLNGVTAQQVKDDIHRFKSLMETGEVATVEGQPSGRA